MVNAVIGYVVLRTDIQFVLKAFSIAVIGYVVLRTDIQFVLKAFSIIWPSVTTDEER